MLWQSSRPGSSSSLVMALPFRLSSLSFSISSFLIFNAWQDFFSELTSKQTRAFSHGIPWQRDADRCSKSVHEPDAAAPCFLICFIWSLCCLVMPLRMSGGCLAWIGFASGYWTWNLPKALNTSQIMWNQNASYFWDMWYLVIMELHGIAHCSHCWHAWISTAGTFWSSHFLVLQGAGGQQGCREEFAGSTRGQLWLVCLWNGAVVIMLLVSSGSLGITVNLHMPRVRVGVADYS